MADNYYQDNMKHPESVFLMHFRYATHGKVSIGNSHPFRFADGAMIHNGVMNIPGLPDGVSDSKFFTRNVVDRLPEGWMDRPWWCGFLEKSIGTGNKLAFLFNDNRYLIVNEKAGHWRQDKRVWFSNYSYNTPAPTYASYINDEDDDSYYGQTWLEWLNRKDKTTSKDIYRDEVVDCCEVETPSGKVLYLPAAKKEESPIWCDDCYMEIDPEEGEHACDIPAAVLADIDRRYGSRHSRRIVRYPDL